MPNKVKIISPRLDAVLQPETASKSDRTINIQFYSGATVKRYSFFEGEYNLSFAMKPDNVRLEALNSGRAPILDAHSDMSTRDVLGVIEKGWLESGRGMASARFAAGDDNADQAWNKIEQGILRNVSMGARIHKLKDISGEKDKVKSYLATDWEPLEISMVPIGADPDAQVMMSDQSPEVVEVETDELRATTRKETKMEDTITNAGEAARTEAPAPQRVTDEDLNAARNTGVTAEQGRITGILRVAKVCGLELAFAERHINENTSLDTFRKLAIDEQAQRAANPQIRHVHADILHDEADKRRCNMTGALLERFEPGKWSWDDNRKMYRFHKEAGQRMYDGARNYAACTLLDIAKECLAAQNIRWQDKSRTEIAQLAFQSTSDFPNILADVANKSLRAGYAMVESQWRLIAARRTASDFKSVKELVLDSSTRLTKVPESGEFKRGKLVEGKETWSLSTYGEIIAITRQAIINDDLGAFTRTPMLLGQEVAMLEGDTVYGIITANGTMADGVALFAAGHSNLEASGATISIDELGSTRLLMMKQTSPGGKVLGLVPRYLLVPASKAQLAEQYTSTAYVAATAATVNPLAGRLTPIVEPRLDAGSTPLAWYMFADPNSPNGTVLIYAYLEGQEGPYTETRNGFDVDGVEIKIRHDFGAAAIDYRGAVQNPGQ